MIKIYGASDDLVEIEGSIHGDEIDCYDKSVLITIGEPEASPGRDAHGLQIRMRHGSLGSWSAEVGQIDDDYAIPWPVFLRVADHGYSVMVCVDAPADTPLRWEVES